VAAHLVPDAALTHTRQRELAVRYEPRTATREQILAIDRSAFETAAARHHYVFQKDG
jgi:hypothetical protein